MNNYQNKFIVTNNSVILILILGLLSRLIIGIFLTPGYDEAYYYLYTENLDWSFFDHPILVALTTGFGRWITGNVSIFTLRLGAILLHTGSLFLLYLTGSYLFGKKAGFYTLAIASIIPMFQIAFGTITLPDAPLIFFWTASLFCASVEFFPRYDQEETGVFTYQPSYKIAVLGVLCGLACLGKYHGFLLALGILIFCLITPSYRCVFKSKWAIIGILTFFITLFPLWIWNIQHDWITFRFHLAHRFEPDPDEPLPSYKLPNVLGVFLANVGYLFPTMGFPLWWVSLKNLFSQIPTFLNSRKAQKRSILLDRQWFILCVALPLTIGFTILAYFQQILATWAMPGFWGLTLLLGQQTVIWSEKYSRKKVNLWLKSTAIIVNTLLLIALLHVTTGIFQKNSQYALWGGFVGVENDPSTELLDVKQLGKAFATSPLLQNYLKTSSFIFTNTYYLGGLIDLALRPLTALPITCFSDDMRGYLFWDQSQEWVGQDGLYITLKRFHNYPKFINDYRTYFTEIGEPVSVPLRRGGVTTEIFYIYRAKNLLKPYHPLDNSKKINPLRK